jgi:hypothetical protein
VFPGPFPFLVIALINPKTVVIRIPGPFSILGHCPHSTLKQWSYAAPLQARFPFAKLLCLCLLLPPLCCSLLPCLFVLLTQPLRNSSNHICYACSFSIRLRFSTRFTVCHGPHLDAAQLPREYTKQLLCDSGSLEW